MAQKIYVKTAGHCRAPVLAIHRKEAFISIGVKPTRNRKNERLLTLVRK